MPCQACDDLDAAIGTRDFSPGRQAEISVPLTTAATMATSDIENTIYLLSQGLDSVGEGRFTLNKLRRSSALLQAAEQHPYRWVYFAVQAAVCTWASMVRLGSNATSVSVEFEVADVSEEFLSADLLAGEGDARVPAVRLWAQAVLWASALNPLSVEVLCEGAHPGYRVSFVGDSNQKSVLAPSDRRTRLAILALSFGGYRLPDKRARPRRGIGQRFPAVTEGSGGLDFVSSGLISEKLP